MQTVRQFSEMLEESQWWPAEKLVAWQRSHLGLLLNHARVTAPFYAYRLGPVFKPNGMIDWSRWQDIPILTRGDLSRHFKSILSRAPIAQHGPFADVSSSGSTGHPVTVRTTGWLNDMSAACNWRGQAWAGLDWSKGILTRGQDLSGRAIGDDLGPWGPPWLPDAARGHRYHSTYSNSYASDLEIILERSIYGYAATTNQLEIFFENEDLPQLPSLKAVLVRGGAVSDYLRAQVARVSDARIVEIYSSKEGGAMAHPCSSGHGFHTAAEAVLVEVVDDDGRQVAPGEEGRIVVTPFGSTALPLIRYDQGDLAVAGGQCACGRTLPHLHRIEGRTNAVFTHPDGRRSREMMPIEGRQQLGAGRWQVRQVGPTAFEVDYVRHDWGQPQDLPAFIATFRKVFFDDASVTVREVDDLHLGTRGKFNEYLNLWTGRPTA